MPWHSCVDVEGAVCLLRELVPHLKVKCEKITNTQGAVAVDVWFIVQIFMSFGTVLRSDLSLFCVI